MTQPQQYRVLVPTDSGFEVCLPKEVLPGGQYSGSKFLEVTSKQDLFQSPGTSVDKFLKHIANGYKSVDCLPELVRAINEIGLFCEISEGIELTFHE